MKFAWCKNVSDLAVWNSRLVEEIDLDVYCDMLDVDEILQAENRFQFQLHGNQARKLDRTGL